MNAKAHAELRISRAAPSDAGDTVQVDPIAAEVIRHALNSAANQIKKTLIRTAFSPIIYEVLDFAAALYDRKLRLLAQAPTLPLFMGTLNFCVEAAVQAIGGAERLAPGDVILYNWPYGTGAHAQDAALIQGAFDVDGSLIGYAVVKAHWLDIGAVAPYCTDTTDVFQEGTFFPGVFLFRDGKRVDDMYRCVLANSRLPRVIDGDIRAQASAVGIGVMELQRIVTRHGRALFEAAVERIFDHGEAIVRSYFEKLPNGRYQGAGRMDSNGVDDALIPIDVAIEIDGSDIRVDFSQVAPEQNGPVNSPLPSTISAARVAIAMLAGAREAPNEGHFRAIEVVTRPGSQFDPNPPAPCFLYGWPALQAIEVIYDAMAKIDPTLVPACSGGDICSVVWWGRREETGEMWGDGSPFPVGHGGHARGDGCTMMHVAEAATRFASMETMETRNPWRVEQCEFVADSGGAGAARGGMGYDMTFRILEDTYVTTAIERTRTAPWGLRGGQAGRANGGTFTFPDGRQEAFSKVTSHLLPKGSSMTIHAGGGGGYGDPRERARDLVVRDVVDGLVSVAQAKALYGQETATRREDSSRHSL